MKSGKEKEGLALLERLEKMYPRNIDIMMLQSRFWSETGRWIKALTYLDRADAVQENNRLVTDFRNSIMYDQQPFSSVGHEVVIRGETATENITRAIGEVDIGDNARLGVRLENNKVDIDLIRRVSIGGLAEEVSENQQRAEIYWRRDFESGNQAKASIYAGDDILGGGGEFSLWDIRGTTRLLAYYHKPYWDLLEGVIDGGTEDRIEITKLHRPLTRLLTQASLGVSRFGLDNEDDMANSVTFRANIHYTLSSQNRFVKYLGEDGYIILGYNIDGVYPFDVEQRLAADGVLFRPLPVTLRETHTIDVNFGTRKDAWRFDGFVGYSLDRYGSTAPLFGAVITYVYSPKIEFRLYGSHAVGTDGSGETFDVIGVVMKVRN